MKRSNVWYGYFTWCAGYFGGLLDHKHPFLSPAVAVGGYFIFLFTSRGE